VADSQSEDEVVTKAPRHRGPLRGLDTSNMLAPPDRRHSHSASEDGRQITPAVTPQHETRASRHGKTSVNYSAKWHPMDEVTRPKRPRALAGGSASRQTTEVSDDSEPESFFGGATEDDDDDDDDDDEMPDAPFEREPDAGATRRSGRTEAMKPVNYSRAHHPQDHLLPFHRNRAKRQRRSTSSTKPQKTKASSEPDVTSSQTPVDDDNDGGDKSEDDCVEVRAASAGRATTTASSPREQLGGESGREKRTILTAAADHMDHLRNPVRSLLRGESSINAADALIRGLLHVDTPGHDGLNSSQAVNQNLSDEDVDNQSTGALILGVSARLASVEDPPPACSDKVAGEDAQESPITGHRSALGASIQTTATKMLPTPSSAMDKSGTQIGPWGLAIIRPYSTPQVESSVKSQPLPTTQQSRDAEFPELTDPSSKGICEVEPVESQEQTDAPTSQDVLSRTEGHVSPERGSHHSVVRTEQITQGLSDSSTCAVATSHYPSGRVTAISLASRQASRETQPEELLHGESYFLAAISSSQSPSRRAPEDGPLYTCNAASPKLPKSGQKQAEANVPGLQPFPGGQPLVAPSKGLPKLLIDDPQEAIKSKEGDNPGSVGGANRIQSSPRSTVPAEAQKGSVSSSWTQSEDALLLAMSGA